MSDRRRVKKGQNKTHICRRCGQTGHHHNACTIPPFSWEGPISESLEQLHISLGDQDREQKENDLATHQAHVKRLEWELAHNRGIVIRRRDG